MGVRKTVSYENLSSEFVIKGHDYQRQFSHIYALRLAEMSKLLVAAAAKKWGDQVPIKKLCDLREEQHDTCIVIGTIYKHQTHKPSILREISEENQLAPQPPRHNYVDDEDQVILEDELQRVRLTGGCVDSSRLATGVVCAVYGTIEEDGRFDVREFLFYEGGKQESLASQDCGNYLIILSGLDQRQWHNYSDELNMLQYWLNGHTLTPRGGGDGMNFVRLVVAGNSVCSAPEPRISALHTRANECVDLTSGLGELDELFSAWSESIAVDLMPGAHDPANYMLPQQPFHGCMLPSSSQNSSFRNVPNPYVCKVAGTLVAGCSGQNISDLMRSTKMESHLEALRSTLLWSHISPTAPDTLSAYPFVDKEPFILRECPHIYFTANCDKFATELHTSSDGSKTTRLICVPSFKETRSVVVVNLNTLECREYSFASV